MSGTVHDWDWNPDDESSSKEVPPWEPEPEKDWEDDCDYEYPPDLED